MIILLLGMRQEVIKVRCPCCGEIRQFERPIGEFICCSKSWFYEYMYAENREEDSLICYDKSLKSSLSSIMVEG